MSHLRLLLIPIAITVLVSAAQAQFRGSLRGTVTDPQGAVISGATVTLLTRTRTTPWFLPPTPTAFTTSMRCRPPPTGSPWSTRVQKEGAGARADHP